MNVRYVVKQIVVDASIALHVHVTKSIDVGRPVSSRGTSASARRELHTTMADPLEPTSALLFEAFSS